jgi:hypothetical protein
MISVVFAWYLRENFLDLMILMGASPFLGPSRLFWAQMALASLVAISGPIKISIFRAHFFQWPSKWIFPHQNHYVPWRINNRYINNYTVTPNSLSPPPASSVS